MTDLLLTDVRLRDAPSVTTDLRVSGGRIAAIAPNQPRGGVELLDGGGCLVLPGLVDAHAHIDKTLWGQPWHTHQAGPSVQDRIWNERRVLGSLNLSPETQSAKLIRHKIARGTTHIRTHVDIGPDIGVSHFEGVAAMREAHRDVIDIEIVAFPQTGLMSRPGTLELMEQAVRDGAEVVGGLDPMAIDRDPKGHLDAIFALAERYGTMIDVHLHDPGEMGAVTIEMMIERSRALGMKGRVAVSHAFCLGSIPETRLEEVIEGLLDQDVAIMTHAPGGQTPFPPVRLLAERGVRLFSGSDGVRDSWGPLNTGDMLERAFLIAYRSGFRDDPGLNLALDMVTSGGARVMRGGLGDHGLAVGKAANLVLVDVENGPEAVVAHPVRRLVLKRGRVVARDGLSTLPVVA